MFQKLNIRPILSIAIIVLMMTLTSFEYLPVSIMEARDFISAREMVDDGNWLLTTMNGMPRYQKPPLPTWLAAVSGMVFNLKNIFAMRLPGILMFFTLGVFAYLFSFKLLLDKSRALINALITITSFYIFGIILEAPWDIFAHGFMLIGIFYLFSFFNSNTLNPKFFLLSAFFIGCSILSKGPVSLYALLLPFIISYVIVYRDFISTKKIVSLIGILILGVILGGWWYVYVRFQDPSTFNEITANETANWGSYNVRPFYYYWSFFVQSGIWTVPAFISLLYPYLKTRVRNLKAYQFTLIWTLISVVLLSIIPEKKSRYLMPTIIPLALNTGFYIDYLIHEFKNIKSYLELIPVYLYFGILAIICFVIPISVFYMKDYFIGFGVLWYTFIAFSLLVIGLAIFFGLKNKNAKTLFLAPILMMSSILLFLPPIYNKMYRNNYNTITRIHKSSATKDLDIYVLDEIAPEMLWKYGSKIPVIKVDSMNYTFPSKTNFGLLISDFNEEKANILKENNFSFKKIITYNLNRTTSDSKDYKDRLISDLYLIKKL